MILVKNFSIELKVPFVEEKINEESRQEACAEIRADHLVKHGGLDLKRFVGPRAICFMLVIIPYFLY